MTANRTEYKREYARNHYARIEVAIPAEAKPALEAEAAAAGEKPAAYVKNAVLQRLGVSSWAELIARRAGNGKAGD